ncbi:hypothetical protein J2741_000124 [Methanolinea mesophila]|uniref:hypothetical protein n=1 Tax=Methanolinea mesophila TaxID=547055 RepID=UPI001AEA6D5D|nr:hypothetical protein [Methanolinea mesophila]MBP1927577.1 hypothetical protein [Methanolinea mesophila]
MKDEAVRLAEAIMNWDREDVYVLLEMINGLDRLVEEHFPGEKFIDLSRLPSVPIPELDVACVPYPVWAMDVHERCLVGDRELWVEPLENLLYGHRCPQEELP